MQEALGEGAWFFQPPPSVGHAHPKTLAMLPLVALIFYEVSGGPFGTEDAVSAGSPLLALLGFIIFPLLWSIPEALVCAEMATLFPENSGYVAWVTAAFGPFWGFMEGFWSWVSGVTDNTIYPVLFTSYLEHFLPILKSPVPRIIFLLSLTWGLTYMNYRGLTLVGRTAILLSIFTILPFLAMLLLALPQIQPHRWLVVDLQAVRWGDYINIMFWNLNYWDSASTLAGEVANPAVTFPRALAWSVLLVVAMYLVPLLVGIGVSEHWQVWTEGHYAALAERVGGVGLAWWVIAAAALSNIGQFQAEMSSDAFQLLGMAERGFLPAVFAKRSRHGTPTLGICLSSLGIVAMATLDFTQIIELLNAIYCLAELLEFAAFIHLRFKHPDLPRPYRVPLPNWAVVLMLLPASTLALFVLALPVLHGNIRVLLYCGVATLLGAAIYHGGNVAREKEWMVYLTTPPEGVEDLLSRPPVTHEEGVGRGVGQAEWDLIAAVHAAREEGGTAANRRRGRGRGNAESEGQGTPLIDLEEADGVLLVDESGDGVDF